MAAGDLPSAGHALARQYANVERKAITTSAAELANALTIGKLYIIQTNIPAHISFGAHGSVTAATTDHFELGAYQPLEVFASTGKTGISCRTVNGAGSLYVLEVIV